MKLSIHSAILCSMAFYTTLMAYGFSVVERGFVFRFKFLFLREVGLLVRPLGFLIRRFSKFLGGSLTFAFVPSYHFLKVSQSTKVVFLSGWLQGVNPCICVHNLYLVTSLVEIIGRYVSFELEKMDWTMISEDFYMVFSAEFEQSEKIPSCTRAFAFQAKTHKPAATGAFLHNPTQ